MEHAVAVAVLCVAVGGIAAQWLAWSCGSRLSSFSSRPGCSSVPDCAFSLRRGLWDRRLQPIIGLAVAIVVFEGGLALNFRDLRVASEGVLRLTIIALPLSWAMGALAAHLVGENGLGILPSCSARSRS